MAILRPDIYEHNNANYAIADSDFVRGGLRTAVADLTALYALSPKVDQLKERATIVYVTGETKYYILVDIGNVGNVNGWEEFVAGGSGNGTVTGATNGLILINTGTTAILGGDLIQNTTINLSTFDLKFSGDSLQYSADYSATYVPRSIPDVGFVTGYTQSAITSNLNTVNVCNIGVNYTATCDSDFIGVTGGTAICINLPASPKAGQKITVSDVCGNALGDNIIISGGTSGRQIAGCGYAIINTDFGSMTFVNNNTGTSWSAISFVM